MVLGGRNFNVTLLRANGSACDVALSRNSKTSFFQFHKFIYFCNPFSENVRGHPCFFIGLPKYREIVNVYVFKTSRLFGFSYI